MSLEQQLQTGIHAVLEASKIFEKRFYAKDFGLERKADGSPRTLADSEMEIKIREIVMKEFPKYSFIGEEFAPITGTENYTWHCDPIDGTWCPINGEKTASISLALEKDATIVAGIVYNPLTKELFCGAEGIITTLNDKPLPEYNKINPQESVYDLQISAERIDDIVKVYTLKRKNEIGKVVSRGGSIAYNLAQVAEGSHSGYIAAGTRPANSWDIAAGKYLVESVGGKVGVFEEGKVIIAATNPILYQLTVDLLSKVNFLKK